MAMTICKDCFYCKLIHQVDRDFVRCGKDIFPGKIPITNTFITTKRNCPSFDADLPEDLQASEED